MSSTLPGDVPEEAITSYGREVFNLGIVTDLSVYPERVLNDAQELLSSSLQEALSLDYQIPMSITSKPGAVFRLELEEAPDGHSEQVAIAFSSLVERLLEEALERAANPDAP